MRRNKNEVGMRVLTINVEGYRGRDRPKKWMDCMKDDMHEDIIINFSLHETLNILCM